MTVRGAIRNLRWLYAEGLEVWVALVGPDGTVAARDAAFIVPNPLFGNRRGQHQLIRSIGSLQPMFKPHSGRREA